MADTSKEPIRRDAILSRCKKYRYVLNRVWDDTLPQACFIMLNPSTADAEADDPTIRRCIGLARLWGCGGIRVVNLFAYRSTDPKVLGQLLATDPIGADNDQHIVKAAAGCSPVVAAWGANVPASYLHRVGAVKKLVRSFSGVTLMCLGRTKAGDPRHPLYVRNTTPLEPLTKKKGKTTL